MLVWSNSVYKLFNSIHSYKIAQKTHQYNIMLNNMLQGGLHLAFERGRTNVLLTFEKPIDQENLEIIKNRRTLISNFLDPIIFSSTLSKTNTGVLLRAHYDKLIALRLNINTAFSLPKEKRDATLSIRWFDLLNTILSEISTVLLEETLTNEDFPPQLISLNRMKLSAYDLRIALGTEATIITQKISLHQKLNAQEKENILNLRGQVETYRKSLIKEAAFSRFSTTQDAISELNKELFVNYTSVLKENFETLQISETTNIEVQQMMDISAPALDTVGKIIDLLTNETEVEIQKFRQSVRTTLYFNIGLALFSLLAGMGSLYVFIIRLIIPMRKITVQIERFANGNLDDSFIKQNLKHDDEITQTWNALLEFRENLLLRNQLEEQLKQLSNIDGLTGIKNRRALNEALENEWRRSLRIKESTNQEKKIAIAMLDIDFFKKYNDRYGHLQGDECLKAVANILKNSAQRAGDCVGRFGGEEFLALLPDLSLTDALDWAQNVQSQIQALSIPHEESIHKVITVSIGVVSLCPSKTNNVLDLIRLADEALYRAKARGRNCVEPAS